MKIGNIIITTEDTLSKQQSQVADYLQNEIEKINKAEKADGNVSNLKLNKNLSSYGLPYTSFYTTDRAGLKRRNADMDILRFWSDELPLAPQSIEFIIKTTWNRGGKLVLNEGKTENKVIKDRINSMMKRANGNKQSLKSVIQTMQRHSLRVGNGYIEKIYNRGKDRLAELRTIMPWNVIVLVDEDLQDEGILKVLSYAKVADIKKVDVKKIPNKAKIPTYKMIHHKYIDEGGAYGLSAFEKNQELTKLIINILNLNSKKFGNEVRHSLHIKLAKKATQVDADIFLAQYRAQYIGTNNFGKPLMTFGDIEVERWPLEDEGFEYNEFMEKTGKNHAPTLVNIAPSEIENTEAKYSNASQGHVSTVLNTIYDWQTIVEDIINDEIIPDIEGQLPDSKTGEYPENYTPTYKFVLERENLFTMYDHAMGITALTTNAVISPNEARQILDPKNLPEVEEDWAKQYYMKLGNEVRVVDEEFFAGTDDEEKKSELSFGEDGKLKRLDQAFKDNKDVS